MQVFASDLGAIKALSLCKDFNTIVLIWYNQLFQLALRLIALRLIALRCENAFVCNDTAQTY